MKKIFFLLLVLSHLVFAFKNEPNGFRGIKWGESLKYKSGFYQINTNCYKRYGEKLMIGECPIESILYFSHSNQFYYVEITVKGWTDFMKLKRIYTESYGRPKNTKYDLTWESEKLKISFWKCNSLRGTGFYGVINYRYSLPIFRKEYQIYHERLKRKKLERLNKIKNDL